VPVAARVNYPFQCKCVEIAENPPKPYPYGEYDRFRKEGAQPWRFAVQMPSGMATVKNAMTLSCDEVPMTVLPRVSHCANPECNAEFTRLGQGTLFICPSDPEVTVNRRRQTVIWLCDACAPEFGVQLEAIRHNLGEVDRPHQSY
jgi:hypothetical protein